jgi:hypothetical protein
VAAAAIAGRAPGTVEAQAGLQYLRQAFHVPDTHTLIGPLFRFRPTHLGLQGAINFFFQSFNECLVAKRRRPVVVNHRSAGTGPTVAAAGSRAPRNGQSSRKPAQGRL